MLEVGVYAVDECDVDGDDACNVEGDDACAVNEDDEGRRGSRLVREVEEEVGGASRASWHGGGEEDDLELVRRALGRTTLVVWRRDMATEDLL